jgi:hypothetical protein
MKVKTRDHRKKVLGKAKKATVKNLGHAGAKIRLVARRSIRRSKKAVATRKAAAHTAWQAEGSHRLRSREAGQPRADRPAP